MDKNKAIIFGIDSDIGNKTAEIFKSKNYEIIGFSKNLRNKNFKNIKCNFENVENIKKKISKINFQKIKSILIFIGKFKKSQNKIKSDRTKNFLIVNNIFESIIKKILIRNLPIRIITITSLDSYIPNINSFKYSLDKTRVSMLIKLYKKKYKKFNVNFDEVAPGPTNTKMRINKKENKGNILDPKDIANLCWLLSEINVKTSFDAIKIYSKNFIFYER